MFAGHLFVKNNAIHPRTTQAVAIIYKNIVAHNLVQFFCTFVRKVQVLYILFTFCRKYVLCYNKKDYVMFNKKNKNNAEVRKLSPKYDSWCKGACRGIKSQATERRKK